MSTERGTRYEGSLRSLGGCTGRGARGRFTGGGGTVGSGPAGDAADVHRGHAEEGRGARYGVAGRGGAGDDSVGGAEDGVQAVGASRAGCAAAGRGAGTGGGHASDRSRAPGSGGACGATRCSGPGGRRRGAWAARPARPVRMHVVDEGRAGVSAGSRDRDGGVSCGLVRVQGVPVAVEASGLTAGASCLSRAVVARGEDHAAEARRSR